jgi:hypothetical protein
MPAYKWRACTVGCPADDQLTAIVANRKDRLRSLFGGVTRRQLGAAMWDIGNSALAKQNNNRQLG